MSRSVRREHEAEAFAEATAVVARERPTGFPAPRRLSLASTMFLGHPTREEQMKGNAMKTILRERARRRLPWAAACSLLLCLFGPILRSEAQQPADPKKGPGSSSYDQVTPVLLGQQTFEDMRAKDKADKAAVMARQRKLQEE